MADSWGTIDDFLAKRGRFQAATPDIPDPPPAPPKGIAGAIARASDAGQQSAIGAAARVKNLPAPGGIGMMLLAIVLLLLILVPVGNLNETRLMLLWDVLRGDKALPLPDGGQTSNGATSGWPGTIIGPFIPPGGAAPNGPLPIPLPAPDPGGPIIDVPPVAVFSATNQQSATIFRSLVPNNSIIPSV